MTAALIAAASALFGVGLGALLSGTQEHRRWLRNERYAVYLRAVTAARTMLYRCDEVDAYPTPAEVDVIREAMFQVRDALAAVEVVAAGDVGSRSEELRRVLGRQLYQAHTAPAEAVVRCAAVEVARSERPPEFGPDRVRLDGPEQVAGLG